MDLSNIDDFLDSTIDDYLVGLAHGIQQAQRDLNQLTVPGQPGQPAVAYHLPRVEFELRMTMALRGGATPSTRGKLYFRPVRAGDSYEVEAASVIRGSFVAVPVAGGRPPPLVRCTLVRRAPREAGIVVTVTDALGAPLADVEVEFNVDRERSMELGKRTAPIMPGTDVKSGVLRTGADGRVENTLLMATNEPRGAAVVVTIDALGASETVIVTVE